jgi:hypothetical protein
MVRHVKLKHQPISVRFRVSHRAALIRAAEQLGVTVPALIRSYVLPNLDLVSGIEPIQFVIPNIPTRSIVAPANRAPVESPASRSGFSEKLK